MYVCIGSVCPKIEQYNCDCLVMICHLLEYNKWHFHTHMHALLSMQLAMERTNSKETNKKRIQSTVYENDYNYLNYYIYDKF